ncbi:nucleotide sugar dehydrogenase [Spirosoma utsteinense]|uniref:UDP-N-acetyl-D-galactosamine dehydrogenase n=1 Tax=Spirosoma utsteinense TaxID=2585773 RepID=A0ABR6W7Z4_9BACT|nr:nucleotide sugar dehydrogenase [Spirosoma utsteinense]MBC3786079.1 UDP-N-acetyl-D-galactosamine dehydrogenase [Spirosoma utsteinense]MBC3792268.1 UDP-N-acetyl-D-galactosamine dehydrogenase [Spirosoma utsteinense]
MLNALRTKEKVIAVLGLGYVGLPLALEFARQFRVIGYDIQADRVAMMQRAEDPSRQMTPDAFANADITFTADPADLRQAHFFVIAVPTPVDDYKVPDLKPLQQASEAVGRALKQGDYVVYESTVYPGCTEGDCLPLLEHYAGLTLGTDFKIGYSPERINPGDKVRTLTTILKIVSGSDPEAARTIADVYGSIITAGIYTAPTIKVAEAAKVIENTQRDLNISLMNELAIMFDKMGVDTQEVLKAAATKWNFLPFTPGLVGGHCIGIDPYYLLYKSRQLGYDPQVIHSGRRINDGMPAFIATKLLQKLLQTAKNPSQTKVLVMGLTFKENIADIRNSKVADLVRELMNYSINVHLVDPHASPNEVAQAYRLTLMDEPASDYDAVIVAVGHDEYRALDLPYFKTLMNGSPILLDLKGLYTVNAEDGVDYWRL